MNKDFLDWNEEGYTAGVKDERERLIHLLKKAGALRDSMLGPDWYVLSTERGSMDITRDRLEGNE